MSGEAEDIIGEGMRGMGAGRGHATSEFLGKLEEIDRTISNNIKDMMAEMRRMRF